MTTLSIIFGLTRWNDIGGCNQQPMPLTNWLIASNFPARSYAQVINTKSKASARRASSVPTMQSRGIQSQTGFVVVPIQNPGNLRRIKLQGASPSRRSA